jgi:radical SAM protein with 4Fe4S-binding SPASM domain
MAYLIKTPFYSYLIEYFNDKKGFRESRVITINKLGAKEIYNYSRNNLFDINFINNIKKRASLKKISISGSFKTLYPLHFQIELTDLCNFKCDYCYKNALNNSKNHTFINFKKLKLKLNYYKSKNLKEIGITGGEPTLHPDFINIMKFVLDNFELVELITNGSNPDILVDLFNSISVENKQKLNLSISFNEWFRESNKITSKDYYLTKTIKQISKLHPIRIICTDYKFNLEKKKQVLKNLKKLGVRDIYFSYVSPIGRAKSQINEKDYIKMYKIKDSKVKDGFTFNNSSCGLIFKHNCIEPNGNIKPCALFPSNFTLGNIFNENYFFKNFNDLYKLPSPNKEICKNCNYFKYCVGCIYKGLYNSNKQCYYKKYVLNNLPLLYNLGGMK